MNKPRPKTKINKSRPEGVEKKKIRVGWTALGGIILLVLSGFLLYSMTGSKVVVPPASSGSADSHGAVATSNPSLQSLPPGSKRLTFSSLPLTAENDLAVFYGGADYSNPMDRYEWEINGAIIPGEQTSTLKKGRFKKGDAIKVRLLLNGGSETVVTDQAVVVNSPPRIASIKFEPFPPTKRDTLTPLITATDADGDSIAYTYKWLKEDGSVLGTEPSIKGSLFNKNDKIILEVVPSDGQINGPVFRTAVVIANSNPKITSIPAAFSGKEYSYQVIAEDPDQDPITYTLSKGPAGMTIDRKTGLVKWAFTEKDAGSYPIEIEASDPDGAGDIQSFILPLSFTTTSANSPSVENTAEK